MNLAAAIELPPALEEGVIVWDPRGVVVTANAAAERMIGVPPGALDGVTTDGAVLLSPDGDPLPPEQWPAARVARTGGRVDQEIGVPHADGGVVWLSMRSARLEDGTVASAFVPIGEAEAKARAAARIAAIVDDSPDLVWMFDGRGLIEYASPSVSTALGLRQDELIGRLWRALTHPDDVPVLRAALADAGPDEPRTPLLELRLRAGDGTWRWVEGQATLRFRDGQADRRRGHRARRHPHARRRGAGPAAVVAARGARRRRAGRDRHGRRGTTGSRSSTSRRARCSSCAATSSADIARAPRRRCAPLLADPDAAIARLREIARGGEPVRFHLPRVPRRAPDELRLRAAGGRAGCGCSATSRASSSWRRSSASSWPR